MSWDPNSVALVIDKEHLSAEKVADLHVMARVVGVSASEYVVQILDAHFDKRGAPGCINQGWPHQNNERPRGSSGSGAEPLHADDRLCKLQRWLNVVVHAAGDRRLPLAPQAACLELDSRGEATLIEMPIGTEIQTLDERPTVTGVVEGYRVKPQSDMDWQTVSPRCAECSEPTDYEEDVVVELVEGVYCIKHKRCASGVPVAGVVFYELRDAVSDEIIGHVKYDSFRSRRHWTALGVAGRLKDCETRAEAEALVKEAHAGKADHDDG